MDVIADDAKAGFRRIEVLTGPGRRRRGSDEEKARIVAETLQPGATVTAVARRWDVCPQQVWGWRRQAREGHLALVGNGRVPPFVPIVPASSLSVSSKGDEAARQTTKSATSTPCIEIQLAGAMVRVAAGTDGALLTEVLRAIRASAA